MSQARPVRFSKLQGSAEVNYSCVCIPKVQEIGIKNQFFRRQILNKNVFYHICFSAWSK